MASPHLQFNSNPWIKPLGSATNARFRLFCFPSAGASAASYLPWGAALPPRIEGFGIQLPGRGERFHEQPTRDLPAIIEALATATRPLRDRPCIFFGHSLGALIAFELARALRRNGECLPLHLFAAAYRAPQIPDPDPPVHQLPDEEFLGELIRLGGMAPEILADRDLVDLLLPAVRADFAVHETYRYQDESPLTCAITACGGSGDLEVSRDDLAGWSAQTTSAFEMRLFNGGHFFVGREQRSLIHLIETNLPRGMNAS